jgi:hypothetical protein
VFCAVISSKLNGPFFFAEKTIHGIICHDMFEIWLMSQLLEEKPDVVFQQDVVPPYAHSDITAFMNKQVTFSWIS